MIWTVIGLVCLLVLVVIGVMQSVRWKVRHVARRPKLSEVEFAERFFPEEQRETALRIRRRLAPYIAVNAGRIQPSDRLGDDLGLAAGYMRDSGSELTSPWNWKQNSKSSLAMGLICGR